MKLPMSPIVTMTFLVLLVSNTELVAGSIDNNFINSCRQKYMRLGDAADSMAAYTPTWNGTTDLWEMQVSWQKVFS